MEKEKTNLQVLTNGIIKENPTLVLVLGTCPTIAITTMAMNAIGMGFAATFVLVGSNVVISALRKVIPDKVRIPCFIVIIAGFVTLLSSLLQAFFPSIYDALGLFLPLIVVNCIILGRAEMFASKNTVVKSALDGVGMGIGFTLALLVIGSIREILGSEYLVWYSDYCQLYRSNFHFRSGSWWIPCLWLCHCTAEQADQW